MRVERRGGGLRGREGETRPYTERTMPVTTRLERLTHKARSEPQTRFNALMGLLYDPQGLRDRFERQDGKKAPGVDGVRKEQYGEGLEERLSELSIRIRQLGYRPKPVRRVFIPKGDGRYRPLGVPSFEDRLVQDRLSKVLQAIWEPEFLDCSYGFRPGRSAHDALRRVAQVMTNEGTQWVVEADIKGFFDHVSHAHLVRFLEQRIDDPKLLRIVQRFLKAGILEDGVFTASVEGTPQGGLVSPVLSNIYLHYVLDLWFEKRFARDCAGRAYLIRFADDCVPRRRTGGYKPFVQPCCTTDGGRPPEVAVQAEASNHPLRLPLREVVVSELGKGRARPGQVRTVESNASEPLMKCRKRRNGVETGGESLPRDQSGGNLSTAQAASGVKAARMRSRLLCGTWEPVTPMLREKRKGKPPERESTDAGYRGGATRSSGEGPVMGLERRGCPIRCEPPKQPAMGGLG